MKQKMAKRTVKRPVKTIFVAHPVSGDVKGNMKKVLKICAEMHTREIIPIAPYLVALQYLKDEVVEERKLGIAANHEHFYRGFVDEIWLYGDHISKGMIGEIKLARERNIPVIAKTKGTAYDLKKLGL